MNIDNTMWLSSEDDSDSDHFDEFSGQENNGYMSIICCTQAHS
jgi:hypothetical protein